MRRLSGLWLPLLLASCGCALVFVTLGDYGITWDEPDQLSSGVSHGAWLRSPQIESINSFWAPTHDHPPMGSMAAGFLRYPYQSSYYNEWVGGARGAERSFELECWGNAFKGALPWMR
jgi:hypothetical protein